jgi:hypothetical protein
MNFEDAVVKLQNYLGNRLQSFQSNQLENAVGYFEFFVTCTDGKVIVVHVGEPKIVNGVFLENGIIDRG